MSLTQVPPDFKTLEEQIVARVQEGARQFYAEAVAAFQERWLSKQRAHWSAVRWRTTDQVRAPGPAGEGHPQPG